MQVHWDVQSQYHQEIESVFVDGRLSFLLQPRAILTACDPKVRTHTHIDDTESPVVEPRVELVQ